MKEKMSLTEVAQGLKNEGVMSGVNSFMDKARGALASFVPGGDILNQMTQAGMSDNETVAFFQNVLGPFGYAAGAVPTLIQKAMSGDPGTKDLLAKAAVTGGQKMMQAKAAQAKQLPAQAQQRQSIGHAQTMPAQRSPFRK